MTEEQTTAETLEWDDSEYRHCFRWINKVWDGNPAKCGYPGPPPRGKPLAHGIIPPNACPICLALYRYK